MKLNELDPRLYVVNGSGQLGETEDLSEAQGIMFHCPQCLQRNIDDTPRNKATRLPHGVVAWFAGREVPRGEAPTERFQIGGATLAELTLTGPELKSAGCDWTGAIVAGEVVDG